MRNPAGNGVCISRVIPCEIPPLPTGFRRFSINHHSHQFGRHTARHTGDKQLQYHWIQSDIKICEKVKVAESAVCRKTFSTFVCGAIELFPL